VSEENNPILVRKQKWLRLRLLLKERFGRVPDLNAVLMLVGIREVGQLKPKYEKEEKEDLMHVGTCAILSVHGYYKLAGRDADGWPHYEEATPLPPMNAKEQEHFLIEAAIRYFEDDGLM